MQRERSHFHVSLNMKSSLQGFCNLSIKLFAFQFSLMILIAKIKTVEIDFEDKIHNYYGRENLGSLQELHDSFAKHEIKTNKGFDTELDSLESVLRILNIPKCSQVLVFSNTSLQLSKISPRNPRAIFFNDELYLGYVPGGFIELLKIDPYVGAIPFVFQLPQKSLDQSFQIQRSDKCMRCHASRKTHHIPGLLLGSVIPAVGGGTLDVLNRKKPSHKTPYNERFGGWYLSSSHSFHPHWGNSLGRMMGDEIKKLEIRFPSEEITQMHISDQSDPVALLVLEHQIGFTNLCINIQYLMRQNEHKDQIINDLTDELLDYCLFSNEPAMPKEFNGELSSFARHFERISESGKKIDLLNKLNLRTRLFETRCSFMLKSKVYTSLPEKFKALFSDKLRKCVNEHQLGVESCCAHLEKAEKLLIRQIFIKKAY